MAEIKPAERTLKAGGLLKYDLASGRHERLRFPDGHIGYEATFAPRDGGSGEDDGYLVGFVTNEADLTTDEGRARLTRKNGAKGNPLGPVFGRELREAAIMLDERRDLRAVLLTAEGKNFCVGGDLTGFAAEEDLASAVKTMTADYHGALAKLLRMGAPIVTAVQR